MRSVNTIYIGSAAFDVLKRSTGGEVHSVFERTFNILISGELVGVAQSGASRSPINLITDIHPTESIPSLGIRKGMQVRKVGGRVLVGEVLEISLEGAEIWWPKTHAERCQDPELIKRNLELAKNLAVSKAGREGLGQLLPHVDIIACGELPTAHELNEVAKTALPHVTELVKAARSGNTGSMKKAAKSLVGLGPGLSPSADDMLSGFASALWWVSHSLNRGVDRVDKINGAIVSQADDTNLLSRQLLEHAARGEVNERLGELLEALLTGLGDQIEPLVGRVMRIGETSGIDMMVGLLLGVQIGLEMKG